MDILQLIWHETYLAFRQRWNYMKQKEGGTATYYPELNSKCIYITVASNNFNK